MYTLALYQVKGYRVQVSTFSLDPEQVDGIERMMWNEMWNKSNCSRCETPTCEKEQW